MKEQLQNKQLELKNKEIITDHSPVDVENLGGDRGHPSAAFS
jgi:hypothetical protein